MPLHSDTENAGAPAAEAAGGEQELRARPSCASSRRAAALGDQHEASINGVPQGVAAAEYRPAWRRGCSHHGGRASQLRRSGKLLIRQGIWLTVLCMLHGTFFWPAPCHDALLFCVLFLTTILTCVTVLVSARGWNVAGLALANPFSETEISPLYHTGECPAGVPCVLPVNVNITLQYKGAGALTDAIVSIDVYPKNVTDAETGVTTAGLCPLPCAPFVIQLTLLARPPISVSLALRLMTAA